MTLRISLLAAALVAIVAAIGAVFISYPRDLGASVTNTKCTVTYSQPSVGDDVSRQVLATNTLRSFARIQYGYGPAATNTVWALFDEDVAASKFSGIEMSATTSVDYIEFGRATEFPYTGAVTAITNQSSTTVQITECSY